jgi:hypothetical protein
MLRPRHPGVLGSIVNFATTRTDTKPEPGTHHKEVFMNCFNHPEAAAVANCVDCGKALCKECAERHEIVICNDCNVKRGQQEKNQLVKKYIPSIVSFGFGFILGVFFQRTIVAGILIGYVCSAYVWGWFATRNMFRPGIYTEGSFIASARLPIRLFCSALIGIVAMPVGLVKLIRAYIKAKRIAENDGK